MQFHRPDVLGWYKYIMKHHHCLNRPMHLIVACPSCRPVKYCTQIHSVLGNEKCGLNALCRHCHLLSNTIHCLASIAPYIDTSDDCLAPLARAEANQSYYCSTYMLATVVSQLNYSQTTDRVKSTTKRCAASLRQLLIVRTGRAC